jgi:hypothetical protein
MNRYVLAACAAAFSLSLACRADTPASYDKQKFEAFMVSDTHRLAVLQAAAATEKQLPGLCATSQFAYTGQYAVTVAPEFGADGVPTKGMWKEMVQSTGCGDSLTYNVVTVATPDKGVNVIPWLPGDGKADPMLVRDAMIGIIQYATAKNPGCKQTQVIKTHFEAYEGDPIPDALHGPNARKWKETWTLWSCGTQIQIPVAFIPDSKGTAWALPPITPGHAQ